MSTIRATSQATNNTVNNAPGPLLMVFDKLMQDVAALTQEDNKQHNEPSTLKLGSNYPKHAIDTTHETLILVRPMIQNIDNAIKNIDTNSTAGKLQLAFKTKKIKTELDLILEHLKKLNSLDPKKPLVYKKFNVEQFPLPHIVDHKTLALSDALENFLHALNLRITRKSINRLHLRRLKYLNDCVKIMTNDDNRLSALSEQIFQKISMTIDQDSPLGKIRSKACREQVKNINTVIALPKDPDYRKILDDKFKALNDIILIEQSPEKARAKLDAILGYNEKFAELDLEKLSTLENNFTALEEEIAQLKIKKDAQENTSFLNRITTYFFYSPQQNPVSALETAEYNYEVYKKYLKNFHALQQSIEKTYITPLNDLCSKLEFQYTELNKKPGVQAGLA